jgi:predicted nucleic acid-binding Zn ribbon protein
MAFGNKPQSMDDLLKEFMKRIPHRTKLQRGMVLHVWPEIVGEKIAAVSKNLHFEGNRLVLEVDNSAWRHEIHMKRFSITKGLNEKVGSKVVQEIVVRAS